MSKTTLITGATAGIGEAAARAFAARGWRVIATGRRAKRLEALVAALGAFAPINLAALHWHWGLGGVWAGLTAFIVVRFVGMVVRTKGDRWVIVGEQR